MAENSKIEWTDHTFNPWMGCTKVSGGCKHCYAESLMDHRYGKVKWGPQGTRQRTSAANWRKPLQWNKQAGAEEKRYRVFCASLADVFEDRAELAPWRADLFDLIAQTPNLDWLLLTKRPENIMRMLIDAGRGFQDLPPHIWIGTSVEDQEAADKRIPELLKVPGRVRFLSCEPLLGPINLWEYSEFDGRFDGVGIVHDYQWQPSTPDSPGESVGGSYPGIDWVIVGGESGHHARPMQIEWAQSLSEQCRAAGVAFFMKQLGGRIDKRHDIATFPPDLQVREFPI